MKRAASHFLALLAGMLAAVMLDPRPPESDRSGEPTKRASVHATPVSREGDAFAIAWRLLAERDLSFDQRRAARAKLLGEWAAQDPLHLLRFFENRAAPDGWKDEVSRALEDDHPELLLQFARDHGGLEFLKSMASSADPRKILDLFAKEPGIPPEYFAELARRGVSADPEFAALANEVPEGPAREHFFCGVMQAQLGSDQWAAAVETLTGLQDEAPRMAKEYGEETARRLSWGQRAGWLLALPAHLRQAAVDGMLHLSWSVETGTLPDQEVRAFLESMVENGVEVTPLPGGGEMPVERAELWGAWALELPEGGAWEGLRHDALALWLANDESAAASLMELPPGSLRDTAMRMVADERSGEDDPEGVDQALRLMSEEARAEWERRDTESQSDPFAD